MGKVTGAAARVVAPEAAAVRGKKPGPLRHQPTHLDKLPPDWHEEELDARKHDAKWAADERKAGRDPDRATVSGDEPDDQADEHDDGDQADEPAGRGNPLAGMTPGGTGSGVLLGFMVWALVRAYIGTGTTPGGVAGVKALLLAKFLNKNPDGSYMRAVPKTPAQQWNAGTDTGGGF